MNPNVFLPLLDEDPIPTRAFTAPEPPVLSDVLSVISWGLVALG